MNSLINLIVRTILRGAVYKALRKSNVTTTVVLAIAAAVVLVMIQR